MATVCGKCIQDYALADFIKQNANSLSCDFCGRHWKKKRALAFDRLIPHMVERLERHYEDPANSVGYETAEGGYQLATTDTWDLLDELGLGYDLEAEGLHAALANAIGMTDWVHRDPYSLTEEQARRMGWDDFARAVKHKNRYLMFPVPPRETKIATSGNEEDHEEPDFVDWEQLNRLKEITEPAEVLGEIGELFKRYQLFHTVEEGALIFRARIHSPIDRPANDLASLGPPSGEQARFSNRMSPAGVSMFYVGFDEGTAIAETPVRRDGRPAERTLATFRVLKALTLLDLVDLPGPPSVFDSDETIEERPVVMFLNEFVDDLTRPIQKDGREHIEYVPSQVVTEYVRYRLGLVVGRQIDGIRYRSARSNGNIAAVLFFEKGDLVPDLPMPTDEKIFELVGDATTVTVVDTTPVEGGGAD
jgi:hypothetical protein